MPSPARLRDVTGFRGEKIVELRLTDYSAFARPLFRPGFLGDKWPAIDFYVELEGVAGQRPYFLAQTKATAATLAQNAAFIKVLAKKHDVQRLLELPGPTYVLGVHEPTQRVFARSVHAGTAEKAITRIPISHELTTTNLRALYDEVLVYWKATGHKPTSSVFA